MHKVYEPVAELNERCYEPWTPDEVEFLKANYRKLTNVEIGRRLKRSASAIGIKAGALGIRSTKKGRWYFKKEVQA